MLEIFVKTDNDGVPIRQGISRMVLARLELDDMDLGLVYEGLTRLESVYFQNSPAGERITQMLAEIARTLRKIRDS